MTKVNEMMKTVLETLDPRVGSTVVQKWGPLAVVLVWLMMTVAIFFGWAPGGAETSVVYGLVSALAGGYLKHAATTP